MKLAKPIRKLLKLPLTLPLQIDYFRRRIAFEIKQHWFSDLDLQIPLTNGFSCPIPEFEALQSFSEIFVANEYGSFLDEIALPKRWIDLGCHAGFFTLYLAWQRSLAGESDWEALLIDADPRMREQTEKTLNANQIRKHCTLLWGLISCQTGEHEFGLRDGMGSSSDLNIAGIKDVRRVQTVRSSEILPTFPPPYDLVKVDIEGGEYEFFESYHDIYVNASVILVEWHSSDREGSGKDRIRRLLEPRGFRFLKNVRSQRELEIEGKWYSSGVQLYKRVQEAK